MPGIHARSGIAAALCAAMTELSPTALAAVHGGSLAERINPELAKYEVGDPRRCALLPGVMAQLRPLALAGMTGSGIGSAQIQQELKNCNARADRE